MANPTIESISTASVKAAAPKAGSPRADFIDYYAAILDSHLTGTYQGNNNAYKGQDWATLYRNLANSPQYSNTDPLQLADAVLGLAVAQQLGQNINAVDIGTANFAIASVKGAVAGASQFANSPAGQVAIGAGSVINGAASGLTDLGKIGAVLAQAWSSLSDAAMWRSLGWLLLGVILIVVGMILLLKGQIAGVAGSLIKSAV